MTILPIDDFQGYFVSDEGKIYSNLGQGARSKEERVPLYEIKPRLTKTGYARVYMRRDSDNKRVDKYVHRLVATYFIPNPENKNM